VEPSLNVVSLGEFAFYLCDPLAEVTFGERVTWIDVSAFEYSRLVAVDLSTTCCRVIGRAAFSYCELLLRVQLSATLECIGDYAFRWTSVSEVAMGHCERLERVGREAFAEERNLQRLPFPDHLINVDSSFVDRCKSLLSIDLHEGETTCFKKMKAVRVIGLNFFEWSSISAAMTYGECALLRVQATRPLRPAI
jgi:hypothetical protein